MTHMSVNVNFNKTKKTFQSTYKAATFITLHKARALYHWEVAADTKLFQDSSLRNAVCSSGCRTK